MGWAVGYDSNLRRDIGYGVPAYCDHPGCGETIDRGLGYVCGADVYGGEDGCGLHFCGEHLFHATITLRDEDGEIVDEDYHPTPLCQCCVAFLKDPDSLPLQFTPTPDHPQWIVWKFLHPSWAEWRAENPAWVEVHRGVLDQHPDLVEMTIAEIAEGDDG